MKQKSTLTKMIVTLAAMLISLPASAQLSLSAGAKASADGEGAEATADGDAAAATDEAAGEAEAGEAEVEEGIDDAEEEVAPPPPPPPPAPEPVEEEAAPAEEGDAGGTAGYDKGFYIKSNDGNNKLVIHGMAKTRWDLLNDEFYVVDPTTGDAGTNHTIHSAFELPYARINFSGTFLTPKLGYTLYFDFVTLNTVYAFAKWTFIPNKLQIRVGKFKRPISRATLTSSVKRQFIYGPIGNMGGALDTGIELSNNFQKATGLEWAVGIFNGATSGLPHRSVDADFSPVLVGRIGYNNGIKGYADTDFEGGPLRFGVGLSASTEFDHDDNNTSTHYLSLDGMIKLRGLTLSAAGTLQSVAEDGVWDANGNNTATPGLSDIGAYVQGGYLINGLIEPVFRYSMAHNFNVNDDLSQQITGGLTIHFFKNHQFKLENNLSLLIDRGENMDIPPEVEALQDILFTTQLQFFF